MEAVFERKKRLLPRPTDLSFYNWDSQVSTSNATANFQVTSLNATKYNDYLGMQDRARPVLASRASPIKLGHCM